MRTSFPVKRIGEVLKLEYGKPLPKSQRTEDGMFPAYGANGVLCRTNTVYRENESIIVGRKGSAGEVNLTNGPFWPTDVTYFVDHDQDETDLIYLFYTLKFLNLPKLAKGVKPGINRNDVYSLKIPLPTLPEQKRIVAILDEAFAGIDAAIANTEKNLTNARELFGSYLNSMFTSDSEAWTESKVIDLCETIVDCVNRTAPKSEQPTDYKMIRTTNVRNGKISLEKVNFVTKETFDLWTRRQIPKKGDVILTREAPMGEVGMLVADEQVFLGQRLVSYRADPSKLLSQFLLFAMRTDRVQNQIQELASGSTVQHMRVPDSKILLIPHPDVEAQSHITDKLTKAEHSCSRLMELAQTKLIELTALKQSLLSQAFSGELTASPDEAIQEAVA